MFLWCYIRHLNPTKIHPERITRLDKKLINDLDYKGINFPVSKKDFSKIEVKDCICINVFCYEEKLAYPTLLFEQQFKNSIDLLLKSGHYVNIKDFNRFV